MKYSVIISILTPIFKRVINVIIKLYLTNIPKRLKVILIRILENILSGGRWELI
jgi:hypothetical protein